MPRYMMFEKTDGEAVVIDRQKVIAAAIAPNAPCSLRMVEGNSYNLKLPAAEVAKHLDLRIVFESGSVYFNRQHLIGAQERSGEFELRFVGNFTATMAGADAATFLTILLDLETKAED